MNPAREPICSSAAQCRGHDQIYDVPDGIVAVSFDDGPLPAAMALQEFLRSQNQKVTHFYIGELRVVLVSRPFVKRLLARREHSREPEDFHGRV